MPRSGWRIEGNTVPSRADQSGYVASPRRHRSTCSTSTASTQMCLPVEDVVGTVGELIHEGKVRHFGLSEESSVTSADRRPAASTCCGHGENLPTRTGLKSDWSRSVCSAMDSSPAPCAPQRRLPTGCAQQGPTAHREESDRERNPRRARQRTRCKDVTPGRLPLAGCSHSIPGSSQSPGTPLHLPHRGERRLTAVVPVRRRGRGLDTLAQHTDVHGDRHEATAEPLRGNAHELR